MNGSALRGWAGSRVPAGLGSGGSRWRIVWALVTGLVALALVAGSAAEVLAREHQARSGLQAQVALAKLAHDMDAVRFAPSGLVHGQPYDPQENVIEGDLVRSAARDGVSLARLSPLGAPLRAGVGRLSALMLEEIRLVANRRVRTAQALDNGPVSLLYDRLARMDAKAERVLVSRARSAGDEADVEVVGIVGLTALLLVLLVGVFEAGRRRRLRALAEQAGLRASEERFRALVQNSSDVITVVSPEGSVLYQAPSVRGVLGHAPADLEGAWLADFTHPDDRVRVQALCVAASGGEDIRLRHADGSWRVCEARATGLSGHGGVHGVVLNIRDVSQRKELEDQLRHQAFHDELTGLANRALFADRIGHALERRQRTGDDVALLVIDLDDFKAVNDSLGHGHGDRLLAEVATRLRSEVRTADTIARMGGDEFAILLEDPVGASAPEVVAARVLKTFAEPFRLEPRPLVIGASVGVARTLDGETADELLRNADVAMYVAKAKGKAAITVFEPGMQLEVQERLQLKGDLLEAISAGDQMELYYQPVVNLDTRAVVGVEALLRWHHPQRGLVPPLDFLPVAEAFGLIIPLGRWVLHEACRQAAEWRARHDSLAELTMSVNLSARQLSDPDLLQDVHDALANSGLEPGALVLEITETVLMSEAETTIETLRQLKGLGVRLAIDDFGTGYCSLAYLQRFPVDVLKVDRSFTASIGTELRQAALAEAVVKLGATLKLETVAEGIELDEQITSLQTLSCEYGQGFLFAKPLPAMDCEALLTAPAQISPALARR